MNAAMQSDSLYNMFVYKFKMAFLFHIPRTFVFWKTESLRMTSVLLLLFQTGVNKLALQTSFPGSFYTLYERSLEFIVLQIHHFALCFSASLVSWQTESDLPLVYLDNPSDMTKKASLF